MTAKYLIEWGISHTKELSAAAGALLLVWKKTRAPLVLCLQWLNRRLRRDTFEFREKILASLPEIKRNSESITAIEYALYNNGNTGVLQHVARLVARDEVAFERADFPGFECDETGSNLRVTSAYRKLIGANRNEDLKGGAWHGCIYGPLKPDYLAEFARCVASKESFLHEIDFRNPITGEHRGRWVVYAPVAVIGKHLLFSGRMVAAVDTVARSISVAEGWDVELRLDGGGPDVFMEIVTDLEKLDADLRRKGILYPVNVAGQCLMLPVESHQWTTLFPGVQVKHTGDDADCSNFLMQVADGMALPEHCHPGHTETLTSIAGSMIDPVAGRTFKPGEEWIVEPGVPHQATFRNLTATINVRPPCPPLHSRSASIRGLLVLRPTVFT